MQKLYFKKHILGSLVNAMIGDAMGSATECYSPQNIIERFGGKVTTFVDPPGGTFAEGRMAGQLTDDTTQMLGMLDALNEDKGSLKVETVAKHLLRWVESEESRFQGPTTKRAISLLKQGVNPLESGKPDSPMDMGASNGAAMKVAPMGLAHPGDLDAAVKDAAMMCVPTHNTDQAISGAAAVAAAVAEAMMPESSIISIIDASIYGAIKGYEIGQDISARMNNPLVSERIKIAIEVAINESDLEIASSRLVNIIGCGLPVIEAVPAAMGIFVATRGDAKLSVVSATNMGGDSDTVAAIVGAISGAFVGIDGVDQELYKTILQVNKIDIEKKVDEFLLLPAFDSF